MSVYDQFKEFIARNVGDIHGVKLFALMPAAFFGAVFSTPFDVIKTRMQIMYPEHGKFPYRGLSDTFIKIRWREDLFSLWVGTWPTAGKLFINAYLAIYLLEFLQWGIISYGSKTSTY